MPCLAGRKWTPVGGARGGEEGNRSTADQQVTAGREQSGAALRATGGNQPSEGNLPAFRPGGAPAKTTRPGCTKSRRPKGGACRDRGRRLRRRENRTRCRCGGEVEGRRGKDDKIAGTSIKWRRQGLVEPKGRAEQSSWTAGEPRWTTRHTQDKSSAGCLAAASTQERGTKGEARSTVHTAEDRRRPRRGKGQTAKPTASRPAAATAPAKSEP